MARISYKAPKQRTFNGQKFTLSAATRQGRTKGGLETIISQHKKLGYTKYRTVKVGKDYFLYFRK